jgi:cbb3-type cytochrome oxidase subunit 3
VLTIAIALGATLALVAVIVWAHWPQRKGGIASGTHDSDELDDLIERVGNVDRPYVPGESDAGDAPGW